MPTLQQRWEAHSASWRDPHDVVAWREAAGSLDPLLLRSRVTGRFWETLAEREITLLVTREYEHLVIALSVVEGRPQLSYLPLPHPSGLCYDAERALVHVAATRNPNQLVTLAPLSGIRDRRDLPAAPPAGRPLMPLRTRFLPGCLYMHDLALIGGELHANAVGENAVVRFLPEGGVERVWWPRAIERDGEADFTRNYLQLNSIAAGKTLAESFFSASAERRGRLRPGHPRFPVDGTGVIFSGATREPVVRGLTRPHSARWHEDRVWVANSGYGTLGFCSDGRYEPHVRLPGWTRGLCLSDGVAFVGTSRVIPRFRQYAPGLDVARSRCGVHAVDLARGEILGSLLWPAGNQIFALEPVPAAFTTGFVQRSPRSPGAQSLARLYYSFEVE